MNKPTSLMHCVLTAVILLCHFPASATPPPAPEGYKWMPMKSFTDEFNGNKLDSKKWHDHHPRWRGRPPALFVPDTVSVTNGCMQIRNQMLPEPVTVRGDTFTIAGGAVVSKDERAYFGYYESRIKASSVSMSTTFWFSNRGKRKWGGARVSTELDVVELVGHQKTGPDFRTVMHANSHYWYSSRKLKEKYRATGEAARNKSGTCEISPPSNEAFHTYGCWWVDATHARIYLDDEYQFTLTFDPTHSKKPFEDPMHMNMVTETYDWETPPTAEELADDAKNTSYYDWVRGWRLVRK